MKVWLVGKYGLDKYINGVYERIDQAEEAAKDENEIVSVELNLANSCICVRKGKLVPIKEIILPKKTVSMTPGTTVSSKGSSKIKK